LEKLAMKKSLIALAVLTVSGASFAQSSVQIDGVMDVGVASIDYKGNRVGGIANNGSSTSQLNIRGTEDLGGGLKANFRVETDWNTVSNSGNTGAVPTAATTTTTTTDTNTVVDGAVATSTSTSTSASTTTLSGGAASTFGNGELRVGLSGGFGSIDAGAVNYNSLSSTLAGQPFGTAIGSGFAATAARLVRSDNSVKYVSPSFGGLTVSLYNAQKQTKATGSSFSTTFGAYDFTGSDEVGVNYANGPIAASYSNLKQKAADGSSTTYDTLGANYALGAAKLFALVQNTKNSANTVDNSYVAISGTYAMGATTLMASAGSLENKAGAKSKLAAIGADYALSKRTAVYARYESIDNVVATGIAAAATIDGAGTKRTRTAIGVRHAF
jgi:predicted porin